MSWLPLPAARQRAGVSNYGGEADSRLRGSSAPVELNNSEGHMLHDSSSRIGGNACLLPYFDDQSPEDKNRNNIFLRWAASTSGKYDKMARRRLEQRRLGTVSWVLEETAPTKSPPREWKQIVMYLFQGNDCHPGQTAVKRANSRNRERSDRISSTKPVLTYAAPLEVSPTELDATSAGKQVGGSFLENFAAGDMWGLDD